MEGRSFEGLILFVFLQKIRSSQKNAVELNSNLLSACVCRSIRCHYATMRLIKFIASTLGDEYVKRACAVAVQLRIRALLSAKNDRLYFQSLIVQKLYWRFFHVKVVDRMHCRTFNYSERIPATEKVKWNILNRSCTR